uniref:EF-hand domain-containing protein n=1 Tax=Pyrodinium bahamense TaxID=73915 RepID=A0A7S0ANQ0_9DINO
MGALIACLTRACSPTPLLATASVAREPSCLAAGVGLAAPPTGVGGPTLLRAASQGKNTRCATNEADGGRGEVTAVSAEGGAPQQCPIGMSPLRPRHAPNLPQEECLEATVVLAGENPYWPCPMPVAPPRSDGVPNPPQEEEGQMAAQVQPAGELEAPCEMPPRGQEVTPQLPQEEEDQARLIFECFDSDGSGQVSVTEFAALVVKDKRVAAFVGLTGRGGRRPSADAIFWEMCGAGERELSWPAFRRHLALRGARAARKEGLQEEEQELPPTALQLLPEEEKARLIFGTIDTDHSGSITCAELAVACVMRPKVAEFVTAVSRNGKDAARRRLSADKLFHKMDTNGDGAITLDEFLSFVSRPRDQR